MLRYANLQNDIREVVKIAIEEVEQKFNKKIDELRQEFAGKSPLPSSERNRLYSSVRENLAQPKKDVEFVIYKNMEVASWDEVDTLMHAWAMQNHIDVTVKRAEGDGVLGRTRKTYCCKHCGKAPATQEMTTKIGCPFSANWNEVYKDGHAILSLTTLHAEHNHPVGPGKAVMPCKNPHYQGKPHKAHGTNRKVTPTATAESTDVTASRKQPDRTAKKQKLEKEE